MQRIREQVQDLTAIARRDGAPASERSLRARYGGVGLLHPGLRQLGEHPLRRGLDHREGHRRSNPRTRSQSVTAASNARSSTSALLR